MVGITLPSKLTEEEENFQKKLAKLRKKKKAIAAAKVPKVEKQESVVEVPQLSTEVCPVDEQAKKLKKLAAIKEALASKDKTFKKTKRRRDPEVKSSVTFHPFSPVDTESQEQSRSTIDSHQKFDYETSSRNIDQQERCTERSANPKTGKTLFVHGLGLTDSLIRDTFQHYGTISNIAFESERNCAFVTYDNCKSAEEAIKKVNGKAVENTTLRVSFSRKRPNMDSQVACGDSSTSNWSDIASNVSQKGSHKDRRDLVTYDNELFD